MAGQITLYDWLCDISERTDKVFLLDQYNGWWGVWELLYYFDRASRIKGLTWGRDLMATEIFTDNKVIYKVDDGSILYRIRVI